MGHQGLVLRWRCGVNALHDRAKQVVGVYAVSMAPGKERAVHSDVLGSSVLEVTPRYYGQPQRGRWWPASSGFEGQLPPDSAHIARTDTMSSAELNSNH